MFNSASFHNVACSKVLVVQKCRMVDIKLTCRLFRNIEANSVKFNIDINTSKTVDSLKKKIFEEVQKKNDKIFSSIKASNLELWMVHIRDDDEFSKLSLENDGTEGIKELEEKISDYWNDENLPEEGFTNVIIDSPLLTALKRLEQYEGANDYIIPNIHRAGFQDLYYAKIIRINDVLQIDRKYFNTKAFIQCKVADFDAGTLFVYLIDDEEQRKEGFLHMEDLEKWLVECSILDSEDRPREYKNSGENIEIIRNGMWLGSIRERKTYYFKNQELKKRYKDSAVKSKLKQDASLSETLSRLSITETKDCDYSVDSGSNTESVFETGVSQSNILSHIYSPEKVQEYLKEFGFNQNDVAKWDQSVEVPIGINTSLFIAREAVIYGLRCDNVYLYPELAECTKDASEIPNFVTNKCQSVNTSEFINGDPYHSFPENVMVFKWKFQKGNFDEILTSLKKKKINTHTLLFRGKRDCGEIMDDIADGFSGHTTLYSDFGRGLYTTPSINYALKHIRDYGNSRVSALLVFDWSDSGGDIKTKHIKGDEWKSLVKGYVCIRNSTKQGPPQFKEDIFSGKITENNDDIRTCSEPVASHINQVVGKTQKGIRALENRLIAIVYIYQ